MQVVGGRGCFQVRIRDLLVTYLARAQIARCRLSLYSSHTSPLKTYEISECDLM